MLDGISNGNQNLFRLSHVSLFDTFYKGQCKLSNTEQDKEFIFALCPVDPLVFWSAYFHQDNV